ncbi:AraC family transcriptional regulator [Clostridiales bacterium COT073_COT-073]|nr:AraC family transcriptional regulator [Clostridiales bacterium COT073_COT-073]
MFIRKSYAYFYSINLAQKIFWVCFFIATLSLTIAPSLIILQYTNVLQSQIEKKNLATLNQLTKLTDTTLVEENFRHIQYLAGTWGNSNLLSSKTSAVSTYRIFKDWEYYTMIHPNLYSCCLYSATSDTFLSSSEGINYHFLSSLALPYAKHLAQNFGKTAIMPEQPLWLSTSLLPSTDKPNSSVKLLTFVQPYSMLFPFNLQDHYLLINYNMNQIEQQILPLLDSNGYFEFTNAQNQLLYSGKPVTTGSVNYTMYSVVSSTSGWTYRYFVPATFWGGPLFVTLFFGITIILTGLFLAFFLSRFLSKKLYRPLSNLLTTIHSYSDTASLSKNDIDFIQTAFYDLYSSKEILDNNLSLLEYQIGQLIFKGKISSPLEISNKLKLTSFSLDCENYQLLLLAFSPKVVQTAPMLPYESIAFIKETFLSKHSALCVPYPENCVSILLANQNIIYTDTDFQQLQHEISSIFECPCSLFLSKSLCDFSEIAPSFSTLKSGLAYLPLYGYEQIISQTVIENHENSRMHLAPVFIPSIEELLEHNPDKLTEKCREILDFAKSKTLHFADWLDFCHILFYTLENHSQQHNLYLSFSNLKKACFPVSSPQDLIDLCQSYAKLLESIQPEAKKIISTAEYIEDIKQYITENISADLSLETVADKFGLTPNYLSKIFHEYCQLTFSNYLKEAKLKKAAELLKNKNLLVQNIAEAVGYSTPNYFNRIFKEYYGITPLQYRRKYL